MALFLQNRDGGKIDENGLYRHLISLFVGEVITGFAVTQQGSPAMGVTVSTGHIMVPSGNNYPYVGWNDAAANLTISTADASNPRRDLIVSYVDLSVVSSTNPNNPGALKLAVVTGTPSGSPSDPNSTAIHAVIGASNPYSILARVSVAASATTITNSVITDLRTMAVLGGQNIAPAALTLGYAQITSNATATSLAAVSGLTASVTIPAGGHRVEVIAWTHGLYTVASTDTCYMSIWDGTVGSGTKISESPGFTNGGIAGATAMAVVTPAQGAKTYNVGLQNGGSGTATIEANALYPAFILVRLA